MSDNFRPINRRTASKSAAVLEQEAVKTLPPPGVARREVQAKRKDDLAQAAEVASVDAGAIDPSSLTIERELAEHFDELSVSNALPDYHYAWINFDSPSTSRGLMVRTNLARRGWEVVNGDMPEAIELKDLTGNRRLGDVILMRVHKARWAQLEAQENEKRLRQQQGITTDLRELGDRHRQHGLIVHTPETISPDMMKRMETRSRGVLAAKQRFNDGLHQGTIEGVQPGT